MSQHDTERPTAERRSDSTTERRPIESGADAVVAALERAGVEVTFGIQGAAMMPVLDAYEDASLRHVTTAHEQGAAHAADAYGVVTGEPGVCMATSGPGATNLVTGIADASMDSDPLLALTGQVPTDLVGNDAFQETDMMGISRPITKYSTFAGDPDEVGDDVATAYAMAAEGRQGPTLVDLPKDVTQSDADGGPSAPATPETHDPPREPDADAVADAAAALERADRPLVLAGGGVVKGEAWTELRDLATSYGIPVVTTMPGTGAFPEDHELAMGGAGMHGTGYANMAVTMTDCLLAVGTRFDDRLTGDVTSFAPDAEVIHVDIDPAEIGKNVAVDHPVIGGAATALARLDDAMDHAPDCAPWREQCRRWKREYPLDYAMQDDRPLKPQHVVERVDAATPDDAIVTAGVGQHQMWAWQYWTFTEPRSWVTSHGLGAMGYGLPAAVGAKIAAPDREVVCFDGDGSFLMTNQELAVAVREDLDITVVVLDNEAVGMIRQWQDSFYDGNRMASEYGWTPRFDALAEAYGAQGLRVEDADAVDDTVERALRHDGPSVIDAVVDPLEDVYPIVPAGGDTGRFALSEDTLEGL